jgi:hypothetical protein
MRYFGTVDRIARTFVRDPEVVMTNSLAQSAPARTRDDVRTLDAIDAQIQQIGLNIGSVEMQYPTLIPRQVLTRAEYPEAFPHLLMSACTRDVPDAIAQRGTSPLSGWCLSPAVCYHTYAQFTGRVIGDELAVTARGRCFRAEQNAQPGVRQIEFEMREIVLLGTSSWVNACADGVRRAVEVAALRTGLSGVWQQAEDPFFLPRAAGKALMQRLLKVKVEYQLSAPGGLALASVNRHGTFFGQRFDIRTTAGEPVHTACIAVGLDRWWHHAHALDRAASENLNSSVQEVTR